MDFFGNLKELSETIKKIQVIALCFFALFAITMNVHAEQQVQTQQKPDILGIEYAKIYQYYDDANAMAFQDWLDESKAHPENQLANDNKLKAKQKLIGETANKRMDNLKAQCPTLVKEGLTAPGYDISNCQNIQYPYNPKGVI